MPHTPITKAAVGVTTTIFVYRTSFVKTVVTMMETPMRIIGVDYNILQVRSKRDSNQILKLHLILINI